MIPRVIHRIWLGADPMPEAFEQYGRTWSEHHPGWDMRLWTDANLPELRFPDALERCRNPGERSDLIRYEVLLRFGGVYVDTDVECLRPIDPLLDAPAFAGETRPGKLGSAVLGSVPDHPGISATLERAVGQVGEGHQAASAGPKLLTDMLLRRDDVTIFPPEAFYPFHRARQPDTAAGRDSAYAIHHVEASWKTRDDLRADIRRLRGRLQKQQKANRELRQSQRRLRKRLERSQTRRRALEGTLWWRSRALVARVTRPVRQRIRRGHA